MGAKKCTGCGQFLPANATDTTCLKCQTLKKTAELVSGLKDSHPTATPRLFKFEMPSYVAGQSGGIKTWLRQVEIRLKLAEVTGELERYEHVVAALPNKILSRVYDLVNNQPANDPYSTLVTRIEAKFQPTESEQIKRLLQGMKIGDRKPTMFLREMQEVAGDLVAKQVLRELFLHQLPKSLREVLTVINTASLESLAKAAIGVGVARRPK